jgi:hypothetical protein
MNIRWWAEGSKSRKKEEVGEGKKRNLGKEKGGERRTYWGERKVRAAVYLNVSWSW